MSQPVKIRVLAVARYEATVEMTQEEFESYPFARRMSMSSLEWVTDRYRRQPSGEDASSIWRDMQVADDFDGVLTLEVCDD